MRRAARPWRITVTVEGLNIERFVRQAGEGGIRLTRMRRAGARKLTAQLPEEQLPAMQDIALRGGWKLTLTGRNGLGRAAEWVRARWLLSLAVLAAGVALVAASQVVWAVKVENAGAYEVDIRAALEEMSVTAPMLRRRLDLGALRDALEWRYPRIAWFECGWRGTTLVIRPEEGVLPLQPHSQNGACDVVAQRDGIVKAVVTRAGTPVVKPGDFVRAGEVLIKGEERTSEGTVRAVAARGSVTARVWTGASVQMPTVAYETAYTGNEEAVWTLRTPWFDLWKLDACSYAQYDTAVSETLLCSAFLPIRLRVERRMEAQITPRTMDMASVKAQAYEAAVRKLQQKVGPEESLIDIWGNCSMIDTENIVSVAIGEMLVEIGRQAPASGMAAPGGDQAGAEPR
ncbi:MAG: sporulation protein YqfD [Clostridiales bacterium]|nr:sporulation protein YqfD [Clostridiales bacterium]